MAVPQAVGVGEWPGLPAGEKVWILEGNLRAHSGEGVGRGFQEGCAQGLCYSAQQEKQWEHRDVTKDTSLVGLLSLWVTGPAGSKTDLPEAMEKMLCWGCPRAHTTLACLAAFTARRAQVLSNPKTYLLKVSFIHRTCEAKESWEMEADHWLHS